MNFRVDAQLAYATGDQLGVLGSKIENQDFVVMDIGHRGALSSPRGNSVLPW